ncbi:sh3 domain signaling protein [Phlyctema vagabunda]|uniref:Sh3 domain signaling protein n=1 Tax=Phlyctema vagabunda TaxID=108571 RepID=A0ABR4P6Q1_9HELO
MNTMHRQFAKLSTKGQGDNAKIGVLLNDFEDADKMLTKIIEASKAWRDAWINILNVQLGTVTCFEELYEPILGSSDGHGREPALTDQSQIDRTAKLKAAYTELKTDLMEEVSMMDSRIIKPATEARDHIQPMKKTIKKRENKRLDWERYMDKVNNASRKQARSDRENAALAKAEQELAKASEDFKVADAHLRETLPPLVAAAFSILPHLLGAQIMTQNTLLAQYYTILHNYCEENNFPSPPPAMEDVVQTWSRDFKPIQAEVESQNIIARGKAIQQPMNMDDSSRKPSVSGLNIRNGLSSRRPSQQGQPAPAIASPNPGARVMRIPSHTSTPQAHPQPPPSPSPSPPPTYNSQSTDYSSHLSPPVQSSYSAHSPAGPKTDYFQSTVAATKKKPPPPPPPKRIGSNNGTFVVALYDFAGQGSGDLSFKEGDRIRVVKKTDSTEDWWEGELKGVKGSFPANYCKSG